MGIESAAGMANAGAAAEGGMRTAAVSKDNMTDKMGAFTGGGGSGAEIGKPTPAGEELDTPPEGGQDEDSKLNAFADDSAEETSKQDGNSLDLTAEGEAEGGVEGAANQGEGGELSKLKDGIEKVGAGAEGGKNAAVIGGVHVAAEKTTEAVAAAQATMQGVGEAVSSFSPMAMLSNAGAAVGNALSSAGAAISGAFSGAVNVVGGAISAVTGMAAGTASAVASVALPAALAVTIGTAGVGGAAFVSYAHNTQVGDVIDCTVDGKKQLAVTGTGIGDNAIPDGLGDVYSYSAIWTDGWYLSDGITSTGVAASALQGIWLQWKAKGAEADEYGTLTYDGKLLVATTTTYGNVGDNVVFYLDDGTALDCILFDVKRSTDPGCNEWGHNDGHCVLEFEQKPKALGGPGTNPGAANNHPELAGKRVASYTNKGHWSGISMGGGVLDESGAGLGAADSSSNQEVKRNCRKLVANVDNSSAAKAAASYAWPTRGHSDDGTELWKTVRQGVWAGRDQGMGQSYYYKSCDITVATALQWSGTDMTYPMYLTDNQLDYVTGDGAYVLSGGDKKWEEVTAWKTDGEAALLPGDVFLRDGHTGIYVGNEILLSIHGDELGAGYNIVSGSIGDRPPECGDMQYEFSQSEYRVFRCVQPDGDTTYSLIGK